MVDADNPVFKDERQQRQENKHMTKKALLDIKVSNPCLRDINYDCEVESSANEKGDGPTKPDDDNGAGKYKRRKVEGADTEITMSSMPRLSELIQTPDDTTILKETGGLLFTGINHCGKVSYKKLSKRQGAVWGSRLMPFVNALKQGRISAHFSVENKLHKSSIPTLERKVREWSEGKVKAVINTPNDESMSSNAISRSNDSLILYSTALELETRRETTASKESNGSFALLPFQ